MPDFNKGDFTQQGVNGHVNATVRLNEKRLVNIDLTSNEEAEGCTIAGTVTDLLNDKVYPIGAGVSGNIEITENGENINVAPYATATVNVAGGGGDTLLKTMVTIINPFGEDTVPINPITQLSGYAYKNSVGFLDVIPNLDDIVVPAESSVTFPLYYTDTAHSGNVMAGFYGPSTCFSNLVNMTWIENYGVCGVTDATIDSSITITLINVPK